MKHNRLFFIIFTVTIFLYLFFKASLQGISNDEAFTFFYYIHKNTFFPGDATWDANNHILNSFFSIQFYKLFGKDLIFLRLTNVLSFLLYAYYVYKSSHFFKTNWSKVALQVGLLTPVFLLDMFSVSRGYGMSIAFLWAAIYHFVNYFKSKSNKDNLGFWIFIGLAVWSNLSLINSYLIIIGAFTVYLIIKFKEIGKLQKVLFIFPGLSVFIAAAIYSNTLKEKGLLYYGNQEGFVETTLATLAEFQFGFNNQILAFSWLVLMLVLIIMIFSTIKKVRNLQELYTFKYIIGLFLFLNIVGIILLNVILEVNFPEDRTAIYLIPLFIAAFVLVIEEWSFKIKQLRWLHLLTLIIPFGLIQNASLKGTNLWKDLYLSQEMHDVIAKEQLKSERQLTVNGYHLFKWSWQYFNLNQDLSYLSFVPFPDTCSDIIIARPSDLENNDLNTYEKLYQSDFNKVSILKRKKYLTKKLVLKTEDKLTLEGTDEFLELFHDTVNADFKRLNLTFKMSVDSEKKPLQTKLVIETKRKNKEQIYYDLIPLDWLRSEWNNDQLLIDRNLPTSAEDTVIVKAYLWNNKKETFNAKISELSFYSLE